MEVIHFEIVTVIQHVGDKIIRFWSQKIKIFKMQDSGDCHIAMISSILGTRWTCQIFVQFCSRMHITTAGLD